MIPRNYYPDPGEVILEAERAARVERREYRDSPDNCNLCGKLRREGCPECETSEP